jgi:secondary thiamine-phosphate synthase enzyme
MLFKSAMMRLFCQKIRNSSLSWQAAAGVATAGEFYVQTFEVRTAKRDEFVEITDKVQEVLDQSHVYSGAVVVYVPHTTAGVTINENADPDVVHDMLLTLERLVPKDAPGYRHAERNSDSHVKASMMGSSCHVLVEQGRLVLGTWQGVNLCEFDGPRARTVHVQVLGR